MMRRLLLLIFSAVGLPILANLIISAGAEAAYCTYGGCPGYFTSSGIDPSSVDSLITSGLNTSSVTAFKVGIKEQLLGGSTQNKRGAAMVIDWMMGHSTGTGSFVSFVTGYNTAVALEPAWEAKVDDYANGLHPGYSMDLTARVRPADNSAYALSGGNHDDFFHQNRDGTVDAVAFYWPGGAFYIETVCANLLGPQIPPPETGLQPLIDPAINIFALSGAPTCTRASATSYGPVITNRILITCPAGSNNFRFDHYIQVKQHAFNGAIPWAVEQSKTGGAAPWTYLSGPSSYFGKVTVLIARFSVMIPDGQSWCQQLNIDQSKTISNVFFTPAGNRSARACVSVARPVTPFNVTPTINLTNTNTLPGGRQYVSNGTSINVNYTLTDDNHTTPAVTSTVTSARSAPGAPAATAGGTPYSAAPVVMSPNTSLSRSYSSTISGVEGSSVCFTHTVTPSNETLAPASSARACVWVYAASGPIVATGGSDVHASTSCEQPSNSATTPVVGISTNPGSYGEYVVTSSGAIGGFTSNGTPGDTNATAPGYTTVCRPDLSAEADVRYPASNTAGNSFDVTNQEGVFRFASNVTIFGTVSKKITIISPGVVSIVAPGITVSGRGVYRRTTVPSIGVIAKGGINIDHNVTNVDAYLFSDGLINTCTQSTIAVCDHTLTVNGFLMGHQLKLNRTGLFNSPGAISPVGERINMTGQLYLNPPAVFDLPGSFNFLQSLGERPPLN